MAHHVCALASSLAAVTANGAEAVAPPPARPWWRWLFHVGRPDGI